MLDYIVYIGRFQPFHNGHLSVVREAQKLAKKVIILIGGDNEPRTLRNPFTYDERLTIIQRTFMESNMSVGDRNSVSIRPLHDTVYNDTQWVTNVRSTVSRVVGLGGWTDRSPSIGIMSNPLDESSSYAMDFPEWNTVKIDEPDNAVHATQIREQMFENGKASPEHVGMATNGAICEFIKSDTFADLSKEKVYIEFYQEPYSNLIYAPTFTTVDAVVVQSGHVLLVRRGGPLGTGKLALPGGFLEPTETLLNGALRELREETRLKVALPVLKGSLTASKTYDSPYRSQLGRIITTAFLFELGPMPRLPRVQGADDALKAEWHPIHTLDRSEFFDDHYHIIQNMLGV